MSVAFHVMSVEECDFAGTDTLDFARRCQWLQISANDIAAIWHADRRAAEAVVLDHRFIERRARL